MPTRNRPALSKAARLVAALRTAKPCLLAAILISRGAGRIVSKPVQSQEWPKSLSVAYGPYRAVVERVVDGRRHRSRDGLSRGGRVRLQATL